MKLKSYVQGQWQEGEGSGQILKNAVNGEVVAEVSSKGVDYKGAVEYARNVGGKNLRQYTTHDRADMLRDLAKHLLSKKDLFYQLSYATGATKVDSWIDIEGGIGTLFTYSGKARREMPNRQSRPMHRPLSSRFQTWLVRLELPTHAHRADHTSLLMQPARQ